MVGQPAQRGEPSYAACPETSTTCRYALALIGPKPGRDRLGLSGGNLHLPPLFARRLLLKLFSHHPQCCLSILLLQPSQPATLCLVIRFILVGKALAHAAPSIPTPSVNPRRPVLSLKRVLLITLDHPPATSPPPVVHPTATSTSTTHKHRLLHTYLNSPLRHTKQQLSPRSLRRSRLCDIPYRPADRRTGWQTPARSVRLTADPFSGMT